MQQKIKMIDQIIFAMNHLGGHCYFKDLYFTLKTIYPESLKNYKNEYTWRSSVRMEIERHSSDSNNYKGKDSDIFYSVHGIGKGHWGLRKPKITETTMDVTADDEGFVEGKIALKKHILRERNHLLKIKAIKNFKKQHEGKIYCEICGFDFSKKYGDIGKDFIEAHHTKPISQMKENERTKIEDIALLCSNCHSMIHRKRPWLSKENIKSLLVS